MTTYRWSRRSRVFHAELRRCCAAGERIADPQAGTLREAVGAGQRRPCPRCCPDLMHEELPWRIDGHVVRRRGRAFCCPGCGAWARSLIRSVDGRPLCEPCAWRALEAEAP